MTGEDRARVPKVIGCVGCGLGVLCAPPLAGRLLALEPLHRLDVLPLWLLSASLVGLSAAVGLGRFRARGRLAALLVPVLLLLGAEMVTRVWVRGLELRDRADLIRLGRRTYPDTMAYVAHPFLQFTGRPGTALRGNEALGTLLPWNDLGFAGPTLPPEKPPGTVRIACLGGSTTGRGYPERMQGFLRAQVGGAPRFEAMNFGLGWYTSAHSVVNFVLNVVDYAPDYVVFHHAWNESGARNVDGPMRGDYSHAYKAFEAPWVPDAWLLRGSLLYRWIVDRLFGEPDWAFLDEAVLRRRQHRRGTPFEDLNELKPYLRNVRTIVEVARARGITPVLTTQPHTMDPGTPMIETAVHIRQCNQIVRALAREYGDQVLFVDLDGAMTGKNDRFIDLGHMTEQGMQEKAAAIGAAILGDWRARAR